MLDLKCLPLCAAFVLLSAAISLADDTLPCALEWGRPLSAFKNVDSRGYVSVARDIGSIELNGGFKIPLLATFGSGRAAISPYLGRGWAIPLLEAKLVKADENHFQLQQPDGRVRVLQRDQKKPNVLTGENGWVGEIRGDTTVITPKCGGGTLTFRNGTLVQMEHKGHKLDFDYENQRVQTIRDGSIILLQVITDPSTGRTSSFVFNGGQQASLTFAENGLGAIACPGGDKFTFTYETGTRGYPLLNLNNRESLAWDAATGLIQEENDGQSIWTYQVSPGTSSTAPASYISRESVSKERESLTRDETYEYACAEKTDGSTITFTRFIAGRLAGRLQKVEQLKDGNNKVIQELSYDSEGRIAEVIVDMSARHVFAYRYDPEGRSIEIKRDGVLFAKREYDSDGRLVAKTQADGNRKHYDYQTGEVTTIFPGGAKTVQKIALQKKPDPNKSVTQAELRDGWNLGRQRRSTILQGEQYVLYNPNNPDHLTLTTPEKPLPLNAGDQPDGEPEYFWDFGPLHGEDKGYDPETDTGTAWIIADVDGHYQSTVHCQQWWIPADGGAPYCTQTIPSE